MGAPIAPPRKRGRPKGSTNKRAKDLGGFIGARYGATAAQQAAALCMVTPAELRQAGNSMASAMVNKAAHLVELVRSAQEGRDQVLRDTIRAEFERLLLDVRDVTGKELRSALDVCLKRVKEASAGFTLREALDLMARERAQLLPYTDQKQPLAVDVTGKGMAPSVVVMHAGSAEIPAMPSEVENVQVFDGVFSEVSQVKSHGEGQAADLPGLLPPPATD